MAFSKSFNFLQAINHCKLQMLTNAFAKLSFGRAGIQTSAVLAGKIRFQLQGIDTTKYTVRPLPYPKNAGRDYTGRIKRQRIGGGERQRWRWVDYHRVGPKEGPPLIERVEGIHYDPHRSADIAMVASSNHRRWILATENMKKGDLVKTSGVLTDVPVKAEEMDAYPLGSLAVGTVVHNIEMYPGEGGKIARAAGTCGIIARKVNDTVVVKMPSKREMCVAKECMATVGRVSNVDNDKEIMGSPNRMRWLGIRPRSGLWQRKTGKHGRKIRKIKPMKVFDAAKKAQDKDSVFNFD